MESFFSSVDCFIFHNPLFSSLGQRRAIYGSGEMVAIGRFSLSEGCYCRFHVYFLLSRGPYCCFKCSLLQHCLSALSAHLQEREQLRSSFFTAVAPRVVPVSRARQLNQVQTFASSHPKVAQGLFKKKQALNSSQLF